MIVYLAVNRVNGKAYVGQTATRFQTRVSNHISVATLNRDTMPFHRALRKYGKESFDFAVLEECSVENLDEREKHWIAHLGCRTPYGYNRTDGGQGTPGMEYTEERRDKVRQSQLGDRNRMKNPETAKKHGDSISGDKHPFWGKFGKDHPSFGKRFKNSPEACERKRVAYNTPEVRQARSERQRGAANSAKLPGVGAKISEARRLYWLTPAGLAEREECRQRAIKMWAARKVV